METDTCLIRVVWRIREKVCKEADYVFIWRQGQYFNQLIFSVFSPSVSSYSQIPEFLKRVDLKEYF